MPTAEIIAIGTELLLGEIQDTNSRHIARTLREYGVDLYWTTIVGDNTGRIADALHRALNRSHVVITTGGLGPTVDDVTREAVGLALEVEVRFRAELWEQILERYRSFGREPTENNRRQAVLPDGAQGMRNPIGTAPAFLMPDDGKVIYALPGVPQEMSFLLEHAVIPDMQARFDLESVLVTRVLHTAGAGESQIDERIADLEEQANPTVGLAAHVGQVDVRIAAKAETRAAARRLIEPVEAEVRRRLGPWVFGSDEQSLEEIVSQRLEDRGWRLVIVEAGLDTSLSTRLSPWPEVFVLGEVLPTALDPDALDARVREVCQAQHAEVGLGIMRTAAEDSQSLYIRLVTPESDRALQRSYGGPTGYASRWVANVALDLLRRV